MTSTTEEYDVEEYFDDSTTEDSYLYAEEHLVEVLFKVCDYLAQEGRRDLFTKLTLSDIASMIYDPKDVEEISNSQVDTIL